jgi:hypothetical protein
MLVLDDFLPDNIFQACEQEAAALPEYLWTNFTRNNSNMKECKRFGQAPVTQTLVHCFNSGVFIDWLEALTKTQNLVSDPHLIGAGLSRCHKGNSLKLHTDFNWNDELKLNRSLSMILFLNPRWEPSWGGSLEFWDFQRQSCVAKIQPRPNRLLIWHYDERLIHGYPDALDCPQDQPRLNLRIFYYHSNSTPLSAPHRSLYWWDDENKTATDDRTQT